MSATRRFSQAPPDKANELFEKLLATSNTAVKTRERLFVDLKEELELLASLQEEHLFPVLTTARDGRSPAGGQQRQPGNECALGRARAHAEEQC